MSSSFNFPRPTTKTDDLEDLYKTYGVDRAVVLDLASTNETPETVREGYYGAYLSFFYSCGLIFPIPEPIYEILAELGLSFTQIPQNFLRSPRHRGHPLSRREVARTFFVFNMDRASVGEFDFSRLPRSWAENLAPSGSSSMSDEIHGLIGIFGEVVRPGVELRELRSPVSEDETIAATRKRRRSSKVALPGPSPPRFVPEGDGSLFPAQGDLISLAGRMRYAGCGLRSLASSAEKEAYAKVAVASSKMMEAFNEYVVVMEDHGMASRNDKEIDSIGSDIRRLSKEFEATKREGKKDAEKIEALTKDSRRIHHENEALMTQMVPQKVRIAALEVVRDRDIRRASRVARRDFATRYREILESLKDKWTSKKKEVSSEIQLQEVIANIDLLNEFKDGGLTVDAELARLKEMEGDCEDLVASAAVPDWSISELDLPKVSDDSVDQVGGSSVLDDSASS
ncbi:hypothetical protein F2Q68_00034414 [Brassica cretica]|uniref:DUF1204 domain-containing protein n=1 Tax=Brassica cretica TaxID=69181 RepID=A0A8S9H3T9_BRACR|nr:hypothetical protein F2Q68_00034414 [Brassica cretica]